MYFDPDIYEDNKIVDEELARFNVNNTVVDNLNCEITLAEINNETRKKCKGGFIDTQVIRLK